MAQVGVSLRLRRPASHPSPAKPVSVIAQVEDSGTTVSSVNVSGWSPEPQLQTYVPGVMPRLHIESATLQLRADEGITMKRANVAALASALVAATPSMSATIEPIHNPTSSKVDWHNIPDIAFDCEDGTKLRVSHANNALFINEERVGGISQTGAMYTQVLARDKFGNDSLKTVVFLQEIKGPAGALTGWKPWELADASGETMAPLSSMGMWYFFKGQQITKCLPSL